MKKIDELLMIMRASDTRWSLEEPHMENINIRISRRVLEGKVINIEKTVRKKMDIINHKGEFQDRNGNYINETKWNF